MGLRILADLMSSKNGDELFGKVTEILKRFGITTTDSNGNAKDLYTVLCEVAEVLNNTTK